MMMVVVVVAVVAAAKETTDLLQSLHCTSEEIEAQRRHVGEDPGIGCKDVCALLLTQVISPIWASASSAIELDNQIP